MASITVLLIEDSGDDAFLFERAVEKARAAVRVQVVTDISSAQNYLRGLDPYADRARAPLPRLIFLDLRLKASHGTQFLTWAKSHPRFKRIPIVAVSSAITGTAANEILGMGANAVMVKAANFDDWKQAIVTACDLWLYFCVGPEFPADGGAMPMEQGR